MPLYTASCYSDRWRRKPQVSTRSATNRVDLLTRSCPLAITTCFPRTFGTGLIHSKLSSIPHPSTVVSLEPFFIQTEIGIPPSGSSGFSTSTLHSSPRSSEHQITISLKPKPTFINFKLTACLLEFQLTSSQSLRTRFQHGPPVKPSAWWMRARHSC